jgi:peptide deformylase
VTVTVQGQDRHGKQIRIKAQDWLARVFQHEIDHLDGILFIDRAKEIWKVVEHEDSEPENDESAEIEVETGD